MNVALDRDKCTGHGRCYMLSPQVFKDDDEGYGELIIDDTLPPELEARARSAAMNCPERAITVTG